MARLARECLSIAHSSWTEKARLTLVEMARVWTRLEGETRHRYQEPVSDLSR
jgi:hypothetical protein